MSRPKRVGFIGRGDRGDGGDLGNTAGRKDEGESVGPESAGTAERSEKQPTKGRTEQLQSRRAKELVKPVRLHQTLFGHEGWHDGVKRRGGEGCGGTDDEGYRPKLKKAHLTDYGKHGEAGDGDCSRHVGRYQHLAAREAVGDRPAKEQQNDLRGRGGKADSGEG